MRESQLPKDVEPVSTASLQRAAQILGPSSTAAKVIADMNTRAEHGQHPFALWSPKAQMYFVGDVTVSR